MCQMSETHQEKRINYNLQQIALEKCCLVLTEKKLVSPANYSTFLQLINFFQKVFSVLLNSHTSPIIATETTGIQQQHR